MASVYWLTKGNLSVETEGFLLAAQDQTLNTKALQNVFSHSSNCGTSSWQAHNIRQDMIMQLDIFTGCYAASLTCSESITGGTTLLYLHTIKQK